MRASRIFFIIVVLFAAAESIRLWNLSPATLAAHFNVQGAPDRFVSKGEFFYYEVQTVLIAVSLAIAMQILLEFTPMEMLNVPNREVWIAPEQRRNTKRKIGTFFDAIFSCILILIHVIFELAVSANLQDPIHFSAALIIPLIAGFFIFTIGMLFWLISSFHNPPASG